MAHMILISQPFDPVKPHLGACELPVIATHSCTQLKLHRLSILFALRLDPSYAAITPYHIHTKLCLLEDF